MNGTVTNVPPAGREAKQNHETVGSTENGLGTDGVDAIPRCRNALTFTAGATAWARELRTFAEDEIAIGAGRRFEHESA